MENFRELAQLRRSIRDFEDKTISDSILQEIITESCLAPNAQNSQPWRFIIIHDKALIQRLSDESKKNILQRINTDSAPNLNKYREILKDRNFNVFYNAPCLIYIAGPKDVRSLQVDCALWACYFMLSAASRGLGTCWVDLGSDIQSQELLAEIGLPEGHRIVAPLIVGYPKTIPDPPKRDAPKVLKIVS
ncbi:MAG: nitroreductase family protein [Desulfomonilia bacterium]